MAQIHEGQDPPGGSADPALAPDLATPKRGSRKFTPKQWLVTFVVTLVASVGGVAAANLVSNHQSGPIRAMGGWIGSYGDTYLGVSRDLAAVNTDAEAQKPRFATVRADCTALESEVTKGRSDPPMPMSALEAQWSSILDDLGSGAHDCVAGIDRRNRALLVRTQTEFSNAQQAYIGLAKAVERAGG